MVRTQRRHDGAARGRRIDHDDARAPAAQREQNTDTDRTCAVNGNDLPGLDVTTIDGAPGDRHWFYQGTLLRRERFRQLVRHRTAHNRVLRQTATRTIVAMKGEQATMVVLSGAAE